MSQASLAQRLKDPDYLDRHLVATSIVRQIRELDWYDSYFLRRFEAAKRYLAVVKPEVLERFVAGFAPLLPSPDFAPAEVENLMDAERHAELKQITADIPKARLEQHELSRFGRHVVHDYEPFRLLQQELVPLVSKLAGQPVEPGYNFLSLYGASGRCAPHMDQPISMFTLDYCIDQSVEWPIHFSRLVDWPSLDDDPPVDRAHVAEDPAMEFRPYTLQPNKALLFCGSSQWHYRDAMPEGGFCNLLFFHYFPAGCGNLVRPSGWVEHFDLPELEPLLDLFDDIEAPAS